MGIAERREREKAERRKAILESARELILAQGVERVSMEDIARNAELSKATVYQYFSGKEILFNAICEEPARVFLEHLRPVLDTGLTGMAALKYFWRGYVEMFGSTDEMIIIYQVRNFLNPNVSFSLIQEQSEATYAGAVLDSLKNILDQCKAEGTLAPDFDSKMAVHMFLSMFSQSIDEAIRKNAHTEKESILKILTNSFQIVIRGFAREGIDRSLLDITTV